jgi:hypothetical protein
MSEGPLTQAFELGHEQALRQELTTYSIRDGMFIKTTTTRVYTLSRDYNDSTSTVIIGEYNAY